MKKFCVFDIEVLPNCFICCFRVGGKVIHAFEISARKFELEELIKFFLSDLYIFVGYNCSHYDTPICNMLIERRYELTRNLNYLEVTDAAYKMSSLIMGGDNIAVYKYKYLNHFQQLDLMTMMASKALRVSLKSLQVTMCYINVKEMKVVWTEYIHRDKIDQVISYCHNDTGSTYELLTLLKGDIVLRMQIQKAFGIQCLSKDGVGIGVDIFTKFVCQVLGCKEKQLKNYVKLPDQIVVKDYIQPCIEFKTKQFKELLDWYNDMVIGIQEADDVFYEAEEGEEDEEKEKVKAKYKRNVIMGKLAHTFALGGVHSVNKPVLHVKEKGYILRDEDVESYYPSLALAYGFGPDGFKAAFLKVMAFMKQERVVAKSIAGDKTDKYTAKEKEAAKLKNEAFKLALNSILGNLKNKYSPYYAPHMNVAICVNGQLMLAMLIEECELAGIECISSNTDGATFKIHESMIPKFEEIRDRWQVTTKMKLETALYEKMVIYAVNDYIAFKEGYNEAKDTFNFIDPYTAIRDPKNENLRNQSYYVKEKGMFITIPRLGKGLESLIVPKALQNYFGKGIPVEETIRSATSIWDFIRFQKIGKQFTVMWNNEEQQHINRFYVSKQGAYLLKRKIVEKHNKKNNTTYSTYSYSNVLKGCGVKIMNEYEDKPMSDYKIDYMYYIREANKIIRQLEPTQTTLF